MADALAAGGCCSCRRLLGNIAAEAIPAVAELPSHLRDPALGQVKSAGQILGPFVSDHLPDDAALPPGQGGEEGGPIDPEFGLNRRRRDGVVAQAVLELVVLTLAAHGAVE